MNVRVKMEKGDFREYRREGFQIMGLAAGWYLAALAFVLVIGAVLWGLGVFTAPVVGKGEQYKQINSAPNRTFQYQRFFDLDGTIRTQVRNAAKARDELTAFNASNTQRPDENFAITESRNQIRANAVGLGQLCQSNVNQYNNDAQEWTRDQFLDSKLPEHFNPGVCDDPSLLPPAAGGGH
jgi:hypothetical protein